MLNTSCFVADCYMKMLLCFRLQGEGGLWGWRLWRLWWNVCRGMWFCGAPNRCWLMETNERQEEGKEEDKENGKIAGWEKNEKNENHTKWGWKRWQRWRRYRTWLKVHGTTECLASQSLDSERLCSSGTVLSVLLHTVVSEMSRGSVWLSSTCPQLAKCYLVGKATLGTRLFDCVNLWERWI